MKPLVLFSDYDRREVHDIFAPDTPFTEGSGTWGNHGVVPVPNRPGDWVFFVTFGQMAGQHAFDEGVTSDGVLTWQSQPSQDLNDRRIKEWIAHDELRHRIYVFLRTKKGIKYTYLGQLKYITHDEMRSNPVYFNWQILDWQIDQETADRIGLKLTPPEAPSEKSELVPGSLVEIPVPASAEWLIEKTRNFRAKRADYSERDARNRALGLAGEKSVIAFEHAKVLQTTSAAKVKDIRHVALIEGDGAGYDILSFDFEGRELFIEVKTTRGHESTDFFLTANEHAFFQLHRDQYAIYRICNFNPISGTGKLFILRENEIAKLTLEPVSYRVRRGH